jgi:uncharacterized protein
LNITTILWLGEIADKLVWKHKVSREEVGEVFRSRSRRFRFIEKGFKTGDNLYAILGRTNSGRFLIVFFINKKDGAALIISGRDMSERERIQYGKK